MRRALGQTPPPPGRAVMEILHEDSEGNELSYERAEGPGLLQRVSALRGSGIEMSLMPFLGPIGGVLVTIPTVGHNKFAADIGALTGWQMAIGIGTGAEAAGDTTMSSEITTYGGARASVTPTVLTNVVTWTKQWTFTTGASFAVIESGVFKDSILMMRHKYSVAKNVVVSDKLTCTLTDTL